MQHTQQTHAVQWLGAGSRQVCRCAAALLYCKPRIGVLTSSALALSCAAAFCLPAWEGLTERGFGFSKHAGLCRVSAGTAANRQRCCLQTVPV